jgi:hypothetical protein
LLMVFMVFCEVFPMDFSMFLPWFSHDFNVDLLGQFPLKFFRSSVKRFRSKEQRFATWWVDHGITNLVNVYKKLWNMAIEIVDLPIDSMVIFNIQKANWKINFQLT